MTQKNISFWFCTLLSGIVIGIASQRIPGSGTHGEVFHSDPHSFYSKDSNTSTHRPLLKSGHSLAYEGYSNSSWVYNRFTENRAQGKSRHF